MKIIRKSFLLILILMSIFINSIHSQVVTQILNNRIQLADIVKNHVSDSPVLHEIEKPNVSVALKEDERIGKKIGRFAVKVKTTYSEDDGKWIEGKNSNNWKFTVLSNGATSLNFLMSNLNLPLDAEMYIYSKNEKMVLGPVLRKNVHEGYYASDIIYGQEVTIEVILPKFSRQEDFSILINNVGYGIKSNNVVASIYREFGASLLTCQNDINCAVGNPWADVRDGVALITINGSDQCSGSLVEDGCNSGRPFFLTAFHCLDNGDGFLDNDERNYPESAWSFCFFYESPNCGDTIDMTSRVCFSGAEFKAGWNNSDFLLLELLDEAVEDIQYNRVNNGVVDDAIVACISHPRGDAKKISIDNDPLQTNGNFWLIDQWDDGLVEPTSSGGPLFDANHLIIGQLFDGDLNIGCNSTGGSLVDNNNFGRTNISWNGGGTNDTRLSTWLGSDMPPDSSNYLTVTGSNILCAGDTANYCLSPRRNLPNGIISWKATPASWFSTATSGYNSCARIAIKNSFSGNGMATITFVGNIPYGNCGSVQDTISYSFWVGKPDFVLEAETLLMCPRDRGIANIFPIGGFIQPSFSWSFTGSISGTGSTVIGKYRANQPGTGYICATVSNQCGSTEKCLEVLVEECGREKDRGFLISPNPSNGTTSISIIKSEFQQNSLKTIRITDLNSVVAKEFTSFDDVIELDILDLDTGVYIISVSDDKNTFTQSLIKL